jgi:hypothetical protein
MRDVGGRLTRGDTDMKELQMAAKRLCCGKRGLEKWFIRLAAANGD